MDFLSDEWLEAMAARLAELPLPLQDSAGARGAAAVESLTVGQIVTGVPWRDGGELSYCLHLDTSGAATVEAGSVALADVVLVTSYADAKALASGAISPSSLLEAGRVKIRGDAARLLAAGPLVQLLAGAGQALHGVTRFG
jgi:hypothetical protein